MNHTTRTPYGPSVTQLSKGDIVVVTLQISVPDQYERVQLRDSLPGTLHLQSHLLSSFSTLFFPSLVGGLEGLDDQMFQGTPIPPLNQMNYLYSFFTEREFYPVCPFQAIYTFYILLSSLLRAL